VLVLENADDAKTAAARRLVARLTEGSDVEVVRTSAGRIPRTTSGKPQRRRLWESFQSGKMAEALGRREDR
jgi:fatty-acyl-CoA synthase